MSCLLYYEELHGRASGKPLWLPSVPIAEYSHICNDRGHAVSPQAIAWQACDVCDADAESDSNSRKPADSEELCERRE